MKEEEEEKKVKYNPNATLPRNNNRAFFVSLQTVFPYLIHSFIAPISIYYIIITITALLQAVFSSQNIRFFPL